MHIVFAEQHAMVRDVLRPFLIQVGAEARVTEAGCAGEVWRAFRNSPAIDLAILDHEMPGLELGDCITTLSTLHPGARSVVLAPKADPAMVSRAMSAGVSGFIPKRMSARAFVSALHLVMAGERYVPAALLPAGGPGPLPQAPCPSVRPQGTGLTAREREIIDLLRQGLPNKLIARRLNVSEVTVKSHLCHVFRKLGVRNRIQAAQFDRT
ncbi:LuxR C-terminal-related transcriptional regulator [Azospirillum thermophilum]|uniref:DNA-binding response regulator n=1 Tax=Azospirillum thermophilum TaxID=2202148 RepID=A0A2S2CXB9_9PROT|nr:response regulator transcription factor [Azospirillum thermophilum]AWK89162.1 hypothetical protein DEW08_24560 [Azospirillum thermophilum]